MENKTPTREAILENLAENLDWQFAERNDIAVAQTLYAGEEIDTIYGLDEAGMLDGFFAFLKESQILEHWRTLTVSNLPHLFVPAVSFLLLYGLRILFGIASSNALPELLFSNVAAMALAGFNAHQVERGMTQRGAKSRTGKRTYALMDPATLSRAICRISEQELERIFNGTIHCLAALGMIAARAMVAVDGTMIETTPHYRGCGKVAVQRSLWKRGVQVQEIRLVYGWRLIALIDLVTLIPLAIKVVQIESHEAPHLLDLVRQAQTNLAPHSQITSLVVDRAYVDGATLYELDQMGITWYLIAKSNLTIRKTALALSAEGKPIRREERVRHGQGREATQETLISEVIPVRGLRTWDAFRPDPESSGRLKWEDRPSSNGLVIKLWRNQPPSPEDGPV